MTTHPAQPAPLEPTPFAAKAVLASLRILVGAALRVRVEGLDRLPPGPCVIACNHLSYADSMILPAWLPRTPRLYLLGNAANVWNGSRWRNWLVDTYGGVIPVNVGKADAASFRAAVRVLQRGGRLALFPEATTGPREGQLLPFRDGAVAIAQAAGVPLVPAAYTGTHTLWWRKRVLLRLGEPVVIPPGKAAREAASAALPGQVLALMDPYHEPAPGQVQPLRGFLTGLF